MIDWAKVIELRDEIGAEDFDEVVELFLEEVEGAMVNLRPGIPCEELESGLHFLKGSALNLGFQAFSSFCATGEQMAKSGEAARVDVEAVIACYHASKRQFLGELVARLAA